MTIDNATVALAQAGDRASVEAVLHDCEHLVRRVARRWRFATDVESLEQVGRLAVMRSIEIFDPSYGANIRTLAYYRVMRDCLREALRQGRARAMSMTSEDDSDVIDLIAPYDYSPEHRFAQAEHKAYVRARVAAAVERLPDRWREIVARMDLADDPETLADLARERGVSKQALQQQRAQALRVLAGKLDRAMIC